MDYEDGKLKVKVQPADFCTLINRINSETNLIPDLMKSEKGNNFRAISESAILEAINPILNELGWYYEIEVLDFHLDIKEAYGSKGKKLQFIATTKVRLIFMNPAESPVYTESIGMGIDDNDKAMGKAYTYAVKYGLLKIFRLRYSDDPDFKASEPLYLEKAKEETKKEDPKTNKAKGSKNNDKKELPMTEKQRDYILGLMKTNQVTSKDIEKQFGYDPKDDEYIPMPVARSIIKYLEDGEFLPF